MTMIAETTNTARAFRLSEIVSLAFVRFGALREARRTLKNLNAMEDHILADIGLARLDVIRADVAEFGADRMGMLHRARSLRIA